jgi:hypothetical protein
VDQDPAHAQHRVALRARARTTRWCPRSPLSVCDMSAGC